MKKKEFIKYLDSIIKPYGFIKKTNNWYLQNKELIKVINVQKSDFGSLYYLNYGFIVPKFAEINPDMHVYNRLSSIDTEENFRIMDLLNFEKNTNESQRQLEIKFYVENVIIKELGGINTEADLIKTLKSRPHLNDIPLVIKKHFNLI